MLRTKALIPAVCPPNSQPPSRVAEAGKNGQYRFNVYRNCQYKMPGEPNKWEQSCYLPTFGSFQNIDRFGTLTLGK